jgi:hypothetical protein
VSAPAVAAVSAALPLAVTSAASTCRICAIASPARRISSGTCTNAPAAAVIASLTTGGVSAPPWTVRVPQQLTNVRTPSVR